MRLTLTIFLLGLFLCMVSIDSANAQDQIGPPSIGVQPSTADPNQKALDSPKQKYFDGWVGKKFIFLIQPAIGVGGSSRIQNYENWSISNPTDSETSVLVSNDTDVIGNTTAGLVYSKFVGKTITCTDYNYSGNFVSFHVQDYDIDIKYSPDDRQVAYVAPLRELAEAKSAWSGKTIYPNVGMLHTWTSELQKDDLTDMPPMGAPLKIINIEWGDDVNNPLWFIVMNKKGVIVGFYEVGVDKLNKTFEAMSGMQPISSLFTVETPEQQNSEIKAQRARYHWSRRVWDAIDDQHIFIGMTSAQVKMSFGEPNKINEDIYSDGVHQQWIYDKQYV